MPSSEPQVLILAAQPARRDAIVAALARAGLGVRHELVGELSDLVFAAIGRPRRLAVVDLQGQAPLPAAIHAMLHNLAPGTVLVAVDDSGDAGPGFDVVAPLAALTPALSGALAAPAATRPGAGLPAPAAPVLATGQPVRAKLQHRVG